MSEDVPQEFRPRQCHVVKWPDFQGYGFNLHAEKGKAGQYIGKVDQGSPAEAAGLKEGDRIVEVNNVNIGNENHQQVVARIRSGGDETRLLVVDTNADNWYKEQKRVIKGDLPEVLSLTAARDVVQSQEPAAVEAEEVTQEPEPEPEPVPEPEPEPEPEPVVAAVSSSEPVNGVNGDDDHRPRLCHLKLWSHFQGYGFNLHAERDKPGQYIGLVDDNSPASTAGLKVNDRIVEVNSVNIEQEAHGDVIARIKAIPGETRLLVVDRETDVYYREKGIAVSSSMPQTEYLTTPDVDDAQQQQVGAGESFAVAAVTMMEHQPPAEGVQVEEEEQQVVEPEVTNGQATAEELAEAKEEEDVSEDLSAVLAAAQVDEQEEVTQEAVEEVELAASVDLDQVQDAEFDLPPPPPIEDLEPEPEVVPPPVDVEAVNGIQTSEPEPEPEPEPAAPEPEYTLATQHQQQAPAPVQEAPPEPTPAPAPQPTPAPADPVAESLGLGLSVAEMKERLKAKKKQDPRLNKISFEQKYKDFQRL